MQKGVKSAIRNENGKEKGVCPEVKDAVQKREKRG